ncbi:MAG: N-acetyl-gamma-glutamyl-phosphate reductase [Planctomycetota bacterium]
MRIAIVGASGYTGAELVWWLAGHPAVELAAVFGSAGGSAGKRLSDEHPKLRGLCDLPIQPTNAQTIVDTGVDVVFLCTPHAAAAELAPALLEGGARVFDLSAAFRLPDASLYPKHYGFEHPHPGLLDQAVYGLAEHASGELRSATLVAVPGCYPTASLLALRPVVAAGLLADGQAPIIDAVSGISGAGRTPSMKNSFCELSQQPYGVFGHRHTPEIEAHLAGNGLHGDGVVFQPHLGPYDRGILATIHVGIAPGVDEAVLRTAWTDAYDPCPLVRLLPPGQWPAVAAVRGSCFCDLQLAVSPDGGRATLFSAIDNLVKGASGQAIQCMNLALGFDETAGLLPGPKQGVLS